jgi:2-polyprenyl-3-methyl-5-hydroxy-6-metoxy-1,4-benzoquinol methylase
MSDAGHPPLESCRAVGTERGSQAVEVISHPSADITMQALPSGRRRIHVRMLDPDEHVWVESFETSLPRELIKRYLEVHGPAGLGHSLVRIEEGGELHRALRFSTLPFVATEEFKEKRLLDFGCGSGTSTIHLARMFPETEVVGLDLLPELLDPARSLMEHLGVGNVTFMQAKAADSLPDELGSFDFVTLNAVYEHLLPGERKLLLPQLWASLRPGGVLFVNQTPYRWYLLDSHTTRLPFINYMPDWLALRYARRFAGWKRQRVARDAEWETLQRGGIRGATEGQIIRQLEKLEGVPVPLRPRLWGYSDAVDLWYAQSMIRRPMRIKPVMRIAYKAIGRFTGSPFAPDVTMAVRKVLG